MRRAVGRLHTGAHELGVIALVMPVFLAGMELAAEGFDAAGVVQRDASQRRLDRIVGGVYFAVLVVLALRARLGARRAAAMLPALLSESVPEREEARLRLQRLGGPAAVRHLADAVADHGWMLLILFAVLATAAWALGFAPNPLWLTIFVGTAVAIDVRWRGMVADVSDQLPGDPRDAVR